MVDSGLSAGMVDSGLSAGMVDSCNVCSSAVPYIHTYVLCGICTTA